MIETESCVHVVDILQKREEVLQLLKGDALYTEEREGGRAGEGGSEVRTTADGCVCVCEHMLDRRNKHIHTRSTHTSATNQHHTH